MSRLIDVDVHQALGYVFDAITLTRHRLEGQCPLIGFSGAPVSITDSIVMLQTKICRHQLLEQTIA